MSGPAISIVMPACDEETTIREAVTEALAAADPVAEALELVVVDDGSRDATGAILDRLAAEDPRIRVIHQDNTGAGPAPARALDAARGEWLVLLDADRQVPLDALPALFEEARAGDGLLGIRVRRRDPLVRRAVSRGMRALVRLLFGVRLVDGGTPLKILRAEDWRATRRLVTPRFPVPAVALAVVALRRGRRLVQRPVPHRARTHRPSTLRGLRLVLLSLQAAASLAALRARLGRRTEPPT